VDQGLAKLLGNMPPNCHTTSDIKSVARVLLHEYSAVMHAMTAFRQAIAARLARCAVGFHGESSGLAERRAAARYDKTTAA
jgi:hypothetical protein